MVTVKYAQKHLGACLAEIERINESEFPYHHSKDALVRIQEDLKNLQGSLKSIDEHSNPSAVRNLCNQVVAKISYYLPLLGFVLRSTNARNAFELHGPLLRLARSVLGPKTKLLLSSEWDYSPFTYTGVRNLPEFVFIGLPASESANPFLVPLAGHELGHSIWKQKVWADSGFAQAQTKNIQERLLQAIRNEKKTEFARIFPGVTEADLMFPALTAHAMELTILQSEEIFCDLVGLYLFGEAYFHATAYFLSAFASETRSTQYPNAKRRVEHLVQGAAHFKVQVPADYESLFEDRREPDDEKLRFLTLLADDGSRALVPELIMQVVKYLVTVPAREHASVARIVDRFKQAVPATEGGSLSNIVNAAWEALHSPSFAEQLQKNLGINSAQVEPLLTELVLKSIEILEIEARTNRT